MRPPRSLQGRLLAWVLGVLTAVWLAAVLATWFDAQHELDELLDSHLAQAASLLVAQQTHELDEADDHFDVPPLHRYVPQVAFQIWYQGRLAMRSSNAPAEPMSRSERGFETLSIAGTSWRIFAARGDRADLQIYVGEQTESRAAIMLAVMRGMLWPLLFAVPLLGVASWWGIRHGLAPLLRTPIAAIRAQAQVALGADQDGERQHALQATLQGCDRAARLIEQLLTLSQLEATLAMGDALVDLSDITRRVVAELVPRAVERQQIIELVAPQPCRVRGEQVLLAALVRNLVDNAIRYSPPGAPVHISVRGEPGEVVLSADDGGPGLQSDQQKRLGERFFRVLGTGQSGSGLGWSIVRRIAAAHGASIDVGASSSLGGMAVNVRFVR